MEQPPGTFYIGALVAEEGRGDPLFYESDDLVTHGVIVGMTGSGKTGLGVVLLEEALAAGVPCLVIDPKGDMGNLELIFPDFSPADFAPWIDPADAERAGVSVDDIAAQSAETWKKGLEDWGITSDRLRQVAESSDVRIYTPGSTAGTPVNVLGSLDAPELSWDEHAETLRDEIEGFVSSLLVLVGVQADPLSSPEHILLANLIENEWRAGRHLDLAKLVGMVPDPPLRKLGVFQLDDFYPKRARMELAKKLNGLLASPSFAAWLEGDPLDIAHLLDTSNGTPASVIYLAHLSEAERQFVVTLLLAKLVTWMRRQPGTGKLRTLVYMDEVFGFAPPVAEPPAKKQILTILKQARAYGVGMVLSTQNPVDLDYKAMSNAGTWMIGRLQTENDKKRIVEGLADAGGSTDVATFDTLISNLDKRQFVMRKTGEADPVVFGSRWAMSYLAGPLDREAITRLTRVAEKAVPAAEPGPAAGGAVPEPTPTDTAPPPPADDSDADTVPVAPPVDSGVPVAALDPAAPWADTVSAVPSPSCWRPVVVATVRLRYDDRPKGIDHTEEYEAVIDPPSLPLRPEAIHQVDHDPRDFRPVDEGIGPFVLPDFPASEATFWKDLQKAMSDHLLAAQRLTIWHNPALKAFSRPGETEEEFRERCRQLVEEEADAAIAKLKDRYAARIERAKDQIARADRRVAELAADVEARKQQELISGAGDLLGAILGGRSRSAAVRRAASRRSQTQRTAADLESAFSRLEQEKRDLIELEADLADEIEVLAEEWDAKADSIESVEIGLERDDIQVTELKLVWVPSEG